MRKFQNTFHFKMCFSFPTSQPAAFEKDPDVDM